MTNVLTSTAIALAAVVLPLSTVTANELRSATVEYADLNLATSAGQAALDRRIKRAVNAVCGRMLNRPSLDATVRLCRTETMLIARQSRDLAVASYGDGTLAKADRKIRFAAK